MTAFLSPGLGSIGGGPAPGTDTRALQEINSRKKSFANKDFEKNIAYLNNSVDVLSQWSQKLQSGVDSANENILEQIQGFAGDLFVLFAGLEPTGIELGDLKYVLQGIGAFFGINPDTPFPMNLVEAALHFFTTYLVPLDQFTDVIFDAIFAWAADFGLSEDFIESMRELLNAIEALGATFFDLFDSLSDLLGAFGFLNFTSTSGLGDIWDSVLDIVTLITTPLKPVLAILGDLGIPFINALTAIVQGANAFLSPLSFISGAQVKQLGPNILPKPNNDTTIWSVAASNTAGWIFDNTQSSSGTSPGSFTTLGTGSAKRLVTQGFYPCEPGQKFAANAMLKWAGIPSLSNDFGICAVWYTDATELSTSNISIAGGHGSSGGWTEIIGEFTVPVNANQFRFGIRVGGTITTGQVWVDDFTQQLQGEVAMSLISGLIDFLNGLLPWNFFDTILGGSTTEGGLFSFFTNLLSGDSPLFAGNIFGFIPPQLLQLIGLGNLSNTQPNLLSAPGFDTADVISLGINSYWSPTEGHTTPGSFYFIANGVAREIVSNEILVGQDQKVTAKTWVKWSGIVATGPPVISLNINRYMGTTFIGSTQVAVNPGTPTNQPTWQQLSGTEYVIPGDCDRIKLSMRIGSGVTSGTIYFDDAELRKTGQIQQGWVAGLLDSLGGLGDFIQGLLDTLVSIIRGIPFVGGVLGDLFDNFTGQTHTIIATSATTDQILAALGPGNPDADDFERVNAVNLGTKWTIHKTGTGTIAIPNGHDASFYAPGLTTSEYLALSDVNALGNNPSAAVVLATAPGYDVSFFGGSGIACNDIWLKCENTFSSWATRTGLRFRIDSGRNLVVSWFQAGVETVLYTGTFGVSLTAGASFSAESGVGGINRKHNAKLNGAPIGEFTEVGTVSQFGPNYLRRAIGGKLTQSTFNPVYPGNLKQWTAQG